MNKVEWLNRETTGTAKHIPAGIKTYLVYFNDICQERQRFNLCGQKIDELIMSEVGIVTESRKVVFIKAPFGISERYSWIRIREALHKSTYR